MGEGIQWVFSFPLALQQYIRSSRVWSLRPLGTKCLPRDWHSVRYPLLLFCLYQGYSVLREPELSPFLHVFSLINLSCYSERQRSGSLQSLFRSPLLRSFEQITYPLLASFLSCLRQEILPACSLPLEISEHTGHSRNDSIFPFSQLTKVLSV